jgi:hypothetical protein
MRKVGTILSGKLRLVSETSLALVCLFFSLRLICLPILIAYILAGVFLKGQRRERLMNVAAISFLICLCLPLDVEVGRFHGPHWGMQRTGPRFVRFVMGMPKIHRIVEEHGEFISGGCCVMGNEPRWLFVWEELGMGEKANAVAILPRGDAAARR